MVFGVAFEIYQKIRGALAMRMSDLYHCRQGKKILIPEAKALVVVLVLGYSC